MKIDIWPHETDEESQAKGTRFLPVTATVARQVARRSDGQVFGLKFKEDTNPDGDYTGFTWTLQGKFNEELNRSDPYTGYVPNEGDVVQAILHMKKKNDGVEYWHNIIAVRAAQGQPQQDQPLPPGAHNGPPLGSGQLANQPAFQQNAIAQVANQPAPPVATIDERIHKQVGFKGAVELLCAKMGSAKTAYDPFTEKEWKSLADDVWLSYNKLMVGDSPKLFMDEAIKAENGDTQIEETVQEDLLPDSQPIDDTEDLPW